MNKYFKFFAYLLFPVIVTIIASGFKNIFITIGAFIASILVLAFIFRADIMMIIASNRYVKNHQRGLLLMQKAFKTGKLRPKSQLFYAYLLIRNGELDDAESIINKTTFLGKHALKNTDLKTADFNLALILWKRGKLNDAIMEMEQLYTDGYVTSQLYGSLGYFYIANSELEKAVEFCKEGVSYNSDDLITLDNLGQAYILSGMLDEAEEIYNTVFEKKPDFMEPFFNYATLLEKRAKLVEAKEYYEKALECPEKYLSTISHEQISDSINRVNELLM